MRDDLEMNFLCKRKIKRAMMAMPASQRAILPGANVFWFSGTVQFRDVIYRDFAVGNNCDTLPAGRLVEKARINNVKDFTTLFDPEDNPDVKVERVKAMLARNKPVVIGMIVLENFLSLKSMDHVWYPSPKTSGETVIYMW